MTTAQLQTLKTDINAKQNTVTGGETIAQHLAKSQWQKIADYYNTAASPQVDLWKPDVLVTDLARAVLMSEFVALTVQRQNGYFVLTQGTYIDASDANIRTSFSTIFGGASATLTSLTAIAKKAATNFEALFVSGSISSAYKIVVTSEDVRQAMLL